jgi:hypothetical protein
LSKYKRSTDFSYKFFTSSLAQSDPRILLSSALLTKYYSGGRIKNNVMGAACGTYGREHQARFSGGRTAEGRTPLERHRCRWEDNIRMYLQEVGWAGLDWIYLAYDREKWRALVNVVLKFWVP